MTTVSQLIRQLQNLKPELQEKEVMVIAQNGLLMEPQIKFSVKEKGNLDKTKENVEYVVLTSG